MTTSHNNKEIVSHSPERTEAFAAEFAASCQPGDVIALHGDLGAGKTTFVRGIVKGLEADDRTRVTSPTFVLMNIYEGRLQVYHFDFYRVTDASMIADLGFEEYFTGKGVSLVEWPERALELLPEHHITVELEVIDPTTRRIAVTVPTRAIKETNHG